MYPGKNLCITCGKVMTVDKFGDYRIGLDEWVVFDECIQCRKKPSKKQCEKRRDTEATDAKIIAAYRANEGQFSRSKTLKIKYGIGVSNYEAMLIDQKGVCAICGNPEYAIVRNKPRRLAVDHDHKTGKIRGLLCGKCNPGVGLFLDNPVALRKAAEYLERHQGVDGLAV